MEKVDRFGRVLIPRRIRETLNLTADTEIEFELRGRELVIRGLDSDLESTVDDWESSLKRSLPRAFAAEPIEEESKWYPKEYPRAKLGL
ncbi:MAG: AbrB/MazE/SpoVT family DNA-binding domain-containing protein [Candidatus Bathyarchaeota archaeon]|nr:AbrB/MazE/SpoVT family DNA-binding domain-containing protein [Candidatus Bathyarchaeota archaeon]